MIDTEELDSAAVLQQAPGTRQIFVRAGQAPSSRGRRAYFTYGELGVTAATEGQIRAQLVATEVGMAQPTGWHYHLCKAQFLYGLKGWVDLAFEDGTKARLNAGDSVLIPGGVKHNEIATSDDFQVLEVSLPAEMGTVPCEAPVA